MTTMKHYHHQQILEDPGGQQDLEDHSEDPGGQQDLGNVSFSTESESTEFAIRGANKDNSPITLLVEINPMMPEFMHPYLLERFIKQRLVKVDIVEK